MIVVVGLEKYKGGTRVSFVCGHRALAAMARRQRTLDELVTVLSAPLDDLVAGRPQGEGRRCSRASAGRKALLERALEGDARRLLAEARGAAAAPSLAAPVVVAAVRRLARRATCGCSRSSSWRSRPAWRCSAAAPRRPTSCSPSPRACPTTCPRCCGRRVEQLGGRGGGRGNLAQGGGDASTCWTRRWPGRRSRRRPRASARVALARRSRWPSVFVSFGAVLVRLARRPLWRCPSTASRSPR